MSTAGGRRQQTRTASVDEHVRQVVDAAPPLTDDQRARLAAALSPAQHNAGARRAAA
ncbi:hypothetical protein [Micromonospora marina]|uniref:hypothetical protein n=1 Tax=Micromonospora marina TaxID=307120 RepID=UPI003455AF55